MGQSHNFCVRRGVFQTNFVHNTSKRGHRTGCQMLLRTRWVKSRGISLHFAYMTNIVPLPFCTEHSVLLHFHLSPAGSSPAPGMAVTPGSTISSRGVSPTPASSNPFGVAPSMTSISPQPSSLGLSGLRSSPVPPNPMLGMMQPGMGMAPMNVGMGAPGMGLGMMQASPMGMSFSGLSPMAPPGSSLLGPGGAPPPQLILGGPNVTGGVMGAGGSVGGGATTGASTNPFLL